MFSLFLQFLLVLFCLNSQPAQAAYANGYAYRRPIVIDNTKVSTADHSNFPVMISGTYSYLATVANGGKVTNGSGYDIIFTSDADGNTQLDHEIESYTATTGAVIMWVKVPTVYDASDTTFYMFYGKSSVSSSQEDVTGVWSNSYSGVWHFNETSGTVYDATSNNNDGTFAGSSTTGKIKDALHFNSSFENIDVGTGASLDSSAMTISTWVYTTTLDGANANQLLIREPDGGGTDHWKLLTTITGGTNRRLSFHRDFSGSDLVWVSGNNTISTGAWEYYVVTYTDSSTGNTPTFYVNGASAGGGAQSNPTGSAVSDAGDQTILGLHSIATADHIMDEVRVASVERSAGWVATEYNNQNSPSSFYSVGSETSRGAVVGASKINGAKISF